MMTCFSFRGRKAGGDGDWIGALARMKMGMGRGQGAWAFFKIEGEGGWPGIEIRECVASRRWAMSGGIERVRRTGCARAG